MSIIILVRPSIIIIFGFDYVIDWSENKLLLKVMVTSDPVWMILNS